MSNESAAAPVEVVAQIDPSTILIEDNIRFTLKPEILELRKRSIIENGIQTPIQVEKLVPPVKGKSYRLVAGFYRTVSINEINASGQFAPMTIPAFINEPLTPVERFKMQMIENDRENASPMDTAIAIKKAFDLGLTRDQVRTLYAAAKGKKGEIEPASNAKLNMYLSFLDLPKGIQERIHDGRLGVAAAYQLTRLPKESQTAVVQRAEAARVKEEAREKAAEEKYLRKAQKEGAKTKRLDEAVQKVADLKVEGTELKAVQTQRKQELATLKAESVDPEDKAAVKKYDESMKAANKNVLEANKLAKKNQNDLAKALKRKNDLTEAAEAAPKAKPKAGRGKSKGKTTTEADIKSAAKAEGVGATVALSLKDLRTMIEEIARCKHAKTAAIGKLIKACADGGPTNKETVESIAKLVGDIKAVPVAKK